MGPARLTPLQRREISELRAEGLSVASIRETFSICASTVARWVAEGRKPAPCWDDAPRSGRPHSLPAPQRAGLRRAALGGATAVQATGRINKRRAQPVSVATTRRALHGGSQPLTWAPVNHGRTLSPQNAQARVAFCRRHQWPSQVPLVFVDAKTMYVYSTPKGNLQRAWHAGAKAPTTPRSSNATTLFFYAAVGRGFKSPLFFTTPTPPMGSRALKGPAFTAAAFQRAVLPRLKHALDAHYGRGAYRVVLDSARQHTAKSSREAMATLGFPLLEGFPAQSWDLNIIECVWAQLANRFARRRPRSGKGGRIAAKRCWAAIEQSSIDKLVDTLPDRMDKIVKGGGAWLTGYRFRP